MHEFGIAEELLAVAQQEAARAGGRPARVGVRLSPGAADADALRTSFDALVAHRGLSVVAVIEEGCEVGACGCGEPLEVAGPLGVCPACGALQQRAAGGPGIEITFVEVDDVPGG